MINCRVRIDFLQNFAICRAYYLELQNDDECQKVFAYAMQIFGVLSYEGGFLKPVLERVQSTPSGRETA